MKDDIFSVLVCILEENYKYVQQHNHKPQGLVGGTIGLYLFRWCYEKFILKESQNFLYEEELTQLFHHADQVYLNPAFGYGLSGFGWLLDYLLSYDDEAELIEYENYFQQIDQKLQELLTPEVVSNNETEFISGLSGVSVYLQKRCRRGAPDALYRQVINKLLTLKTSDANGNYWPVATSSIYREKTESAIEVNLGLAHGMPSILMALAYATSIQTNQSEIRHALMKGCQWLLAQRHDRPSVSCFSYNYPTHSESRLAWCYGDISIALVLAKAGCVLNDPEVFQAGREIALHCAHRSPDTAGVVDAGLCHGSAGLMLMFQLLAEIYQEDAPTFMQASDFWLSDIIERFTVHGIQGFDHAMPNAKSRPEQGLLEGYAGIGLALLTKLGHRSDWTECLMLK